MYVVQTNCKTSFWYIIDRKRFYSHPHLTTVYSVLILKQNMYSILYYVKSWNYDDDDN